MKYVTRGTRNKGKRCVCSFKDLFLLFLLQISVFFLLENITMTKDSVVFSKETIRFYEEYTGINDYQELKHHLIGIQHKLAKVAISISMQPRKWHLLIIIFNI